MVVNSTAWLFGHRRSIYGTNLMANGAVVDCRSVAIASCMMLTVRTCEPLSEERTLLSFLPYSSVLMAIVASTAHPIGSRSPPRASKSRRSSDALSNYY